MNNEKLNKLIKLHSGLLNSEDELEVKKEINSSEGLHEMNERLLTELNEIKEIRKSFPNEFYSQRVANKVIKKAQEKRYIGFKPSFAYAFIVAMFIAISSQFINLNDQNDAFEFADILSSTDLGDYISLIDLIDFNDITQTSELEIDYFAYISEDSFNEYYLTSIEYEVIESMDISVQDEIYNEILNKNILEN